MTSAPVVDACKGLGEMVILPLKLIDAGPKEWHSRGTALDDDIEMFAAMLGSGESVQHPILVRPHSQQKGSYELVTGKTRYWGAERAGCEAIPARIAEFSDEEAAVASLSENHCRRSLPYLLTGWAAIPIVENGTSQKDLAKQIGCRPSQLSEALSFARAIPRSRAVEVAERNGRKPEVFAGMRRGPLRRISNLPNWEERERELDAYCRSTAEAPETEPRMGVPEEQRFELKRIGHTLSLSVNDARSFTLVDLVRLYLQVARELWRAR